MQRKLSWAGSVEVFLGWLFRGSLVHAKEAFLGWLCGSFLGLAVSWILGLCNGSFLGLALWKFSWAGCFVDPWFMQWKLSWAGSVEVFLGWLFRGSLVYAMEAFLGL